MPRLDHPFIIAPDFGGLRSWLTGCDKCPDFGLTGEGVIHCPGFGEIGEICPVCGLVGGVVGGWVNPGCDKVSIIGLFWGVTLPPFGFLLTRGESGGGKGCQRTYLKVTILCYDLIVMPKIFLKIVTQI